MKYFSNILLSSLIVLSSIAGLTSCNKSLPSAEPIITVQDTLSIGAYLTRDTTFKLFAQAAAKVGFFNNLNDKNLVYTVFALNNAAMRAFTPVLDSVFIANATGSSLSLLGGIVNYHVVPGILLPNNEIPTTFPNLQLPTLITIGTLPGTTVPFRLTAFPSRRASNFWYNIAPGLPNFLRYSNGVINVVTRVTVPPNALLVQLLYGDPQFTMFDSLIAKADLAQPNPALKVDSIIRNPGANLTLFAPTNTAVKAFITKATGGAIPSAAPDAVFFGFIRTSFPATSAQGIVVYHLMGKRAFSVNFPPTPAFFPTLLNGGIPTHPGVNVQSFFASTGLSVDSMKVTGIGNGGLPATAKPASTFDRNGVNGVLHIIDRLLLPQ
jgi:hypothetical protein